MEKPTYYYFTIYIFHIFINRKQLFTLLFAPLCNLKQLILMASSIFNEQLFRHFTCFVKPYLKTFNSILYVRPKCTNIIKDRTVFLKHLKFINLLVVYIWFLARMWSWRVALILENQLHNTLQYVQMCTLKNFAKVYSKPAFSLLNNFSRILAGGTATSWPSHRFLQN